MSKTPYFLQVKYAKMYSPRLKLFTVKNNNPFRAEARCPECGDSQKSATKKRFNLYTDAKTNQLKCQCFNCGYHASFEGFLKSHDELLYKQLLVERFSFETPQYNERTSVSKKTTTKEWENVLRPVAIVDRARDYLKGRQIPRDRWNRLYYTNNLKHTYVDLCSALKVDVDPEKRIAAIEGIFFPFLDEDGALCFSATRNMDSTSDLRYVTIEFQPSYKLFGLDDVDRSKKVYVTEGPMDSLFLDNCIAVGDAALFKAEQVIDKEKLVLVPDNEPRHPTQTKVIKRMVDKGFDVVLFPEWVEQKDLNDMVKAGHDVNHLVECYSYQGLRAQLEFAKWCKV